MTNLMKCPVCSSLDSRQLYVVSSRQAASHFANTGWSEFRRNRLDDLEQEINKIWNKSICQIKQCKHCGASFSDPLVPGTEKFYNLAFDPGYPEHRWEFDEALKSIIQQPNYRKQKYKEIGAGVGNFIKMLLKNKISKSQITAEEYSSLGIKNLKKMGIQIAKSNSKVKYDAIMLFQVFEHIASQRKMLRNLHDTLKKNGRLYLSFPNIEFVKINIKSGGLLDMPPNHVIENTEKSFRLLINNMFRINRSGVSAEDRITIINQIRDYRAIRRRSEGFVITRIPGRLIEDIYFWMIVNLRRDVPGVTKYYDLEKL